MHILIDTSNLLYRGYFTYPKNQCGEILFTLSTIRSYLEKSDNTVYLCLDGKPKGKQIDSEYKANRQRCEISVYRYLPQLVYLLQGLNRVRFKYNPNLEADEVIFSLTRLLSGKKLIVSTDNDLLQSLKDDVEIQRSGKIINESYYKAEMQSKFHAVSPNRLPIYRAIVGDVSDNLKPPVPRFPKELAAKIAEQLPYDGCIPSRDSLIALFTELRKELSKSRQSNIDSLLSNYVKFESNFKIMKLDTYVDLDYSYLGEFPVIPNFPPIIMSIFRTIKSLDKGV